MIKGKFKSKSLIMTMIVAFLITNVLTTLIFTSTVKSEQDLKTTKNGITSLKEITKSKAELISKDLRNIESANSNGASWMEYFIAEEKMNNESSLNYYIKDNGSITVKNEESIEERDSVSTLFVPNTTDLDDSILKEISDSEKMVPIFSDMLNNNEDIVWTYVASENDLLRSYPFYNVGFYNPSHKQTEDNYYAAIIDLETDDNLSTWTKPYVDYFGTGWTMTCVNRVFDKDDNLWGVMCTDINILNFQEKYLSDFSLGESSKMYILKNDGSILLHPDYSPEADNKNELLEINILDDENLNQNKKEDIEMILNGESHTETFTADGTTWIISGYSISTQPWTIFIEVDEEEFISVNSLSDLNVFRIILIGILIAFIFSVALYFGFSTPINELVKVAEDAAQGKFKKIRVVEGFWEIQVLSRTFNKMSDNLDLFTKKLIRKNNQLNSVINSINENVAILDLEGNVIIDNENNAIEELEQKVNFFASMRNAITKVGEENFDRETIINEIISSKEEKSYKLSLNGKIYKISMYPVLNENYEVNNIVVLKGDITKDEFINSEINQIEKLAGAGEFSASIAHEIKNPLAAIKGAVYILQSYEKNGDNYKALGKEELDIISNSVDNAERVVATLLNYSKNESSQIGMINIKNTINEVLILQKRDIIKKQIYINTDINIEEIVCPWDRYVMKIIIQNLISNAINASSENGNVTIKVNESINNKISILVEDDGEGIHVKPKSRIFEPYYSTKKNKSGTGIGLWLTKKLIEDMGGSITVDENRSIGTLITIIIPVDITK